MSFDGVWLIYAVFAFLGGAFISLVLEENNLSGIILSIFVCSLFALAGGFFSIAGPIVSGFNISAVIYASIYEGGIDDVFFWTSFFDFFEIEGLLLKILVLLVSSFSGAVEFVKYFQENLLDQ